MQLVDRSTGPVAGSDRAYSVGMGFYQWQVQPRLLRAVLDTSNARTIRVRVCTGLTGNLLEIGYGCGLNQPHLPPQVTSVTPVEPSATALRLSADRRSASPVPVRAAAPDAQALPYPDNTFDSALCTWTLCGVANPQLALTELARVLRPRAALHFVEHGLAPDPDVARWQRRGSRLNRALAGCVLDRDVRLLFQGSGLTVTSLETYYDPGSPKPAGYFYEGQATA